MIKVSEYLEQELHKVNNYISQVLGSTKGSLEDAYQHLILAKGKLLRPSLFLLSAQFGKGYNSAQFIPLAAAIEILHMATLIHDDIIDAGQIRRGSPTLNNRFGSEIALLAGDDLFAKAFLLFSQDNNPLVVQTMAKVVVSICHGETEQIVSNYNTEMEEENYLSRVGQKTAAFFAANCYLGGIMAETREDINNSLEEYGFNLGMAYQIADDYLDYVGEEKKVGKNLGHDLQQGIITLPIIYALRISPYRLELEEIIKTKKIRGKILARAVELVITSSALEYCLEKCQSYLKKAELNLFLLPKNRHKEDLLKLLYFVEKRIDTKEYLVRHS